MTDFYNQAKSYKADCLLFENVIIDNWIDKSWVNLHFVREEIISSPKWL